jgi:hypothetical protein
MDLILAAAYYLERTSGSHVTSHTGDLVFIDTWFGYWGLDWRIGWDRVGWAKGMRRLYKCLDGHVLRR